MSTMKTLHELHLEHNQTPYGEFDDFVYDYFMKLTNELINENGDLRDWIGFALQRMDSEDQQYVADCMRVYHDKEVMCSECGKMMSKQDYLNHKC
jgi:hypothetical protein